MDGKGVSIQGLKYQQYIIKKRYTSTLGRASMRILKVRIILTMEKDRSTKNIVESK